MRHPRMLCGARTKSGVICSGENEIGGEYAKDAPPAEDELDRVEGHATRPPLNPNAWGTRRRTHRLVPCQSQRNRVRHPPNSASHRPRLFPARLRSTAAIER